LRKDLSGAENGVQRLGEAGSQSPAQGGLGMNGWRSASHKYTGKAGMTQ
jgi:hypothetical protein